jgi:hypothetical protein
VRLACGSGIARPNTAWILDLEHMLQLLMSARGRSGCSQICGKCGTMNVSGCSRGIDGGYGFVSSAGVASNTHIERSVRLPARFGVETRRQDHHLACCLPGELSG